MYKNIIKMNKFCTFSPLAKYFTIIHFTLQLILYYKKRPTINKEAAIGKINVAEYIIPTIILKKILLKKFHSSNLSHTPVPYKH